jgi:hypothetical protein
MSIIHNYNSSYSYIYWFIIDCAFNMCYILVSNNYIVIREGFICEYIFMDVYDTVAPFREPKFCGVPLTN